MDEQLNGFTGFAKVEKAGVLRYAQQTSFAPVSPSGDALTFDQEKLDAIPEPDRRWSWLEIDLNAIRWNVMAIKDLVGRDCKVLAVVKADAYGHGAVRVAKTALNSGAEYLGVATVDEAVELRKAEVYAPILILSEPPASAIPVLLGYKIMPSIYTAEFAIQYAETADQYGIMAPYHLAINTGMNRIGVRFDDVVPFMTHIAFHRALALKGVFTHFATADSPETLDFQIQYKRFCEAVSSLRGAGIDPGIVHCANSAAAVRYPQARFDMVRWGISMYGYHPSDETKPFIQLRPAMSVHTRITDVRTVPMSEGVSYGLHYRSRGSVKICTIPIGYADGYRRDLSGKVDVLYDGVRCRQVGNICMDQCMFEVDMRGYPSRSRLDPQIGDEVVVVGAQGNEAITLDELADTLGTISYELACGLSRRMPRVYL